MMNNNAYSMRELLNEQYQSVESFANAQIRLFNATVADASPGGMTTRGGVLGGDNNANNTELAEATKNLMICRENVRSTLKRLQDELNNMEQEGGEKNNSAKHKILLMQQHLSLSRRVIQTIFSNPSWHTNGIPSITTTSDGRNTSLETNTVALASLKASITRVLELEGT